MTTATHNLEADLAHAWGYIYKLTDRDTGKFFIGSHGTAAGEALDFYFGGNEEVEALIAEAGEERFERRVTRLVASREEAYLEEVHAIALASFFGQATYNAPLEASSATREVILEALPSTAPEDVLFFFEELSVEKRYALLAAIRETFDPAPVMEPEKEISSLSMPQLTVPE